MDTNRIRIESFIVNFYGYVAKLSYKHFNTIPRSFSRMDVPYECDVTCDVMCDVIRDVTRYKSRVTSLPSLEC